MTRYFFIQLIFVLILGSVLVMSIFPTKTPAAATSTPQPPLYTYMVNEPEPLPDITAYVVMDERTGEVLFSHESLKPLPTASVIKLLVAAAALRSPWLTATTTITNSDVAAPEDFGKLAAGEVYTLRDLLFPYLLESSNDAGAAIERTWGNELRTYITEYMRTAAVEGRISVADFNGLSSDTMASAQALATLMRYFGTEDRAVLDMTMLSRYVGVHPLVNNSPFIEQSPYRGGKHGYTPAAGRTAMLRYEATFADGTRPLIIVYMGATDAPAALLSITATIQSYVERVMPESASSGILPES